MEQNTTNQELGMEIKTIDSPIQINKDLLKKRIDLPMFTYLVAQEERGVKNGEILPTIELFEYLFGKEDTKKLFEHFTSNEALRDFLQQITSSLA